jgi:dTDP-4-amino-4,6-dideoxygalactose transaminase
LNGKSILQWGDAATLSFHATKVFHTVEGGAIVFKKREDYERACRLINFGYEEGEVVDEGINAKMSEFHAAMGLCMLDEIDTVLQKREEVYHRAIMRH